MDHVGSRQMTSQGSQLCMSKAMRSIPVGPHIVVPGACARHPANLAVIPGADGEKSCRGWRPSSSTNPLDYGLLKITLNTEPSVTAAFNDHRCSTTRQEKIL